MSAKSIILLILNVISIMIILVVFHILQTTNFLKNVKFIAAYKIFFILFLIYLIVLMVLILKPIRSHTMTYPYIMTAVVSFFWFLYVSALIWLHVHVAGLHDKKLAYIGRVHEWTFQEIILAIELLYGNLIIFTLITISVVGDLYTLKHVVNSIYIKERKQSSI